MSAAGRPQVRVGIIGVGVMGADHARTFAAHVPDAVVAAVADPDPDAAAALSAELADRQGHGCAAFEDPHELIGAVDAVIIASPDNTHEEYVLACLAAGRPVLCEKPLAPSSAACRRIRSASAGAVGPGGRPLLSVGFMRRFDPGYRAMKQALAGGGLGVPLLLRCVHRNAASPPGFTSDMLFTSSAGHEIDIARWLLDDEVAGVRVVSPRRSPASGALADPRLLLLRMTSGVVVDIELFINAGYGYDVRAELVAERGALPLAGAVVTADWRERFAAAYRAQALAWVRSLQPDGAHSDGAHWDGALPSALDGLRSIEVAEAAIRSAETATEVTPSLHQPASPGRSTSPS